MRAGALAGTVALALAALGCGQPAETFDLVISVLSDDQEPFAGFPITLADRPVGRTGTDGQLRLSVTGREGAHLSVGFAVPPGYRAATSAGGLVLRRLSGLERGAGRPIPVGHIIRLTPKERLYAVLVRARIPDLPVEARGVEQAVTDASGVAAFLFRGAPGAELKIRIVTSSRPTLRPKNPSFSFVLASHPEAYVVRERFVEGHRNGARRLRRSGPRRF